MGDQEKIKVFNTLQIYEISNGMQENVNEEKNVITSNKKTMEVFRIHEIEYDENMILLVWDSYIKKQVTIKYFVGDGEVGFPETLFKDDGKGMAPLKSAGLLVKGNSNSLYLNHFGYSVSICGPIDRQGNDSGTAVITCNIEEGIKQIKEWNLLNPEQKIGRHQIIFPYHITGGHWALGVLEIIINDNNVLASTEVKVFNPLPDCGGRKLSAEAQKSIELLLRESFGSSNINLVNKESKYFIQQQDSTSCGAISAENGIDFLETVQSRNRISIKYGPGARELRKKHIEEVNRNDFYEAQFNQAINDPKFLKSENYEDLRNEFRKFIESLSQEDKKSFDEIRSRIKKEGIVEVAINIKDFMVSKQLDNALSNLFKQNGESWEFEGEHINTLMYLVEDWEKEKVLDKEKKSTVACRVETELTDSKSDDEDVSQNQDADKDLSATSIGSDKSLDDLTKEIKQKCAINKYDVKFVINTIIYVPSEAELSNSDSSCTDYNSSDAEDLDFDITDEEDFPFIISGNKIGCIKEVYQPQDKNEISSNVVQPFLNLLQKGGVEASDQNHLVNITASIGLNRMKSLSTRKNIALHNELNADVVSDIEYKKFAFFWYPVWHRKGVKQPPKKAKDIVSNYESVQKFYKKLKKYDLDKANEFRKINEEKATVPYQNLREYAKNHEFTKELISKVNIPENYVYMSFVDGDTISFNGIYSAYMRILAHNITERGLLPTVMSTGYEFCEEQCEDYPLVVASKIDRLVRIETTKYIPLGVYYPEPNTCILVPDKKETIPESFISSDSNERKKQKLESPILLRQVANRENFIAIFSEDNPIITKIPARVRIEIKNFSESAKKDHILIIEDKKALAKTAQSHFDSWQWAINLYIHKAFKLLGTSEEKGVYGKYRGIVTKVDPFNKPAKIYSNLSKYLLTETIIKFVKAAYNIQQKILVEKLGIIKEYEVGNLFDQLAIEAKQNIENVRFILPECCDVNLIYKGYAPIHKTTHVYTENRELLFFLLNECEADPNIQDKRGDTLAHYAAETNDIELLQLLHSKGADFNITNCYNKTALDYTTEHYRKSDNACNFILNHSNRPVEELITSAIKMEDIEKLQRYLDALEQSNNNEVLNNETEKYGLISHIACGVGNMAIIKLLKNNGCNIDARDKNGNTALEEACYGDNVQLLNPGNRLELINYLIEEEKIPITAKALHNSLYCPNLDILNLLLNKGADPNAHYVASPLLWLINQNRISAKDINAIKLLLEYNADILINDSYVGNSLHLAAERGHIKIVEILLEYASTQGILQELLEPSPEECRICAGLNALEIAIKYNHFEIVQIFAPYFSNVQEEHITQNNQEDIEFYETQILGYDSTSNSDDDMSM